MRKRIYLLLPVMIFILGSCIEPFSDPPRTIQVPVEFIESVTIQNQNVNIKVGFFIPEIGCWKFVRNEIKQNNNFLNGKVFARRITDGGCFQQPDILYTEFNFTNLKSGVYTFEFDSFENKIDTTIYIP
ncbi:MAG: hypothetical protein HZB41_05660 [Ignavibacteriae bacterium]|nr:hypothetical protein [Ignavibacteriota bacterium]